MGDRITNPSSNTNPHISRRALAPGSDRPTTATTLNTREQLEIRPRI